MQSTSAEAKTATITLSQLKEKLKEQFSSISTADPAGFQSKLSEFLHFANANYDVLDPEAKSYVDRVFEGLGAMVRASVESMPESPTKRQFSRQLAVAEGKHFLADNLMKGLEAAPAAQHSILSPTRQLCMTLIQRILDILYDVTRQTHHGFAAFAKLGLSYWAVDELLVASHLAQRAFTNQAYTHIRTVYEILDKIELFHVQPEWAEVWASDDDRKVLQELRPSAVRRKLGQPKYDPVYSFFSEMGPHGTFKGLQARGVKEVSKGSETTNPRIRLWVGGCPIVHHIVWSSTACVHAVTATLLKVAEVFADDLNQEEIEAILRESIEASVAFIKEHYLGWATGVGLDCSEMVEFLNKAPWREALGPS